MENKKSDISVVSIPTYIELECPYCQEDIKINYNDFCDLVGEPCDWSYESFNCPHCKKTIDIGYVDWD